MWRWFKTWVFYIVYALDLFVNAIFDGSPHETISSRCYRLDHIKAYRIMEIIIDAAFYPVSGPGHCQHSYQQIVDGGLLPDGFLERALQTAAAMNAVFDKQRGYS